jgi:NADH dehydrogenase
VKILITGITGFVGSHLAARLVAQGHDVRGTVRQPNRRRHLAARTTADLVTGDVTQRESIIAAMQGMDAVAHLVAIPFERGTATYASINAQGTRNVVDASKAAGVKRFLHLSALAVDSRSPYAYLRSKGEGEDAVRESGLDWTIFRPSVLVGEEDEFANALARWLAITPLAFPLVGDGQARFQPLWVEDLVTIVVKALNDPTTIGKSFDLGGPEILTYEAMVKQILFALHRSRILLKVPVPLMKPVVKGMELILPKPPATTSLLDLLSVDNSTAPDAVERQFGFKPRPFREVIGYLNRYPFARAFREALLPA